MMVEKNADKIVDMLDHCDKGNFNTSNITTKNNLSLFTWLKNYILAQQIRYYAEYSCV